MGKDTKLAEGLHLVKLRVVGGNAVVTLPREIREQVKSIGMLPDTKYLAVRALGDCIVITRVSDVTVDGAFKEFEKAFKTALLAWEVIDR